MQISDEEIEVACSAYVWEAEDEPWDEVPPGSKTDVRKAMRAALLASRAARPHLFVEGAFTAHSGETLLYKIDLDALTDGDIETLAAEVARQTPPFSAVEGVPRGGLRLAAALEKHRATTGGLLIVDDVLTTGASMEAQRAGRDARGVVIFARGPWPVWVMPVYCTPQAHIAALRAQGYRVIPVADYKRLLDASEVDDMIVRCEICGAWLDRDDPATAVLDDFIGCWKAASHRARDSDLSVLWRKSLYREIDTRQADRRDYAARLLDGLGRRSCRE